MTRALCSRCIIPHPLLSLTARNLHPANRTRDMQPRHSRHNVHPRSTRESTNRTGVEVRLAFCRATATSKPRKQTGRTPAAMGVNPCACALTDGTVTPPFLWSRSAFNPRHQAASAASPTRRRRPVGGNPLSSTFEPARRNLHAVRLIRGPSAFSSARQT